MRDLLVCVPSRGRPSRLGDMLDAALSLSEAATDIAVGVDDDDPALDGYESLRHRAHVLWRLGTRRSVSGWTNHLARSGLGKYRAFASLGDDHVPRTPGWDRLLLEAIGRMGGTGIAYGNDLLQGDLLPTHWVMSADITAALGWLMPDFLRHYQTDDVIRDIGKRAGCLAYVPGVVIEHCHPGARKGAWDQTYASEAARDAEDLPPYGKWLAGGGPESCAAKVTALLAAGSAR